MAQDYYPDTLKLKSLKKKKMRNSSLLIIYQITAIKSLILLHRKNTYQEYGSQELTSYEGPEEVCIIFLVFFTTIL